MKKSTFIAIVISLMAVAAMAPGLQVFAQAPEMSEEKRSLYAKYYEKNKGTPEDQKVAYQLAQEFVQKYGVDDDAYVKATKKFITKYEAAKRLWDFDQALGQKDYSKVFETGKTVLEHDPENFGVIIKLASAGQMSAQAGNTTFNTQALNYAKQAAQMLEANKVTDPAGMTTADALGYAYFVQGFLQSTTSPAEAAAILTKAAKTTGAYKEDPTTFYLLGTSIINGEYQTLADEYRKLYTDKPESPEQKAMLEKVNALGERGLDSIARAVALASKPEQAAFKKRLSDQLTELYKDMHKGSTDGLNELIAGVLAKPLP
jgi:hypothetical protein